jgi:hypothetical protein
MPERDQIILDALARALSLVEEAGKANSAEDKASYQLALWKSAAESEYVAFQISTSHGLGDYDLEIDKGRVDPKASTEIARGHLQEAQSVIQSDPRLAYSAVRNAVTVLRRLYGTGEKTATAGPLPKNE